MKKDYSFLDERK